MDAQEALRVEARLETRERQMHEMRRSPGVRNDVIPVGREPRHAVDSHGNERTAGSHE